MPLSPWMEGECDGIDPHGLLEERKWAGECELHEGRKLKWAVEYMRMPGMKWNPDVIVE